MIPSFPVAGLMLAASGVAAPGVDMLFFTPLSCKIVMLLPLNRNDQYIPPHPRPCQMTIIPAVVGRLELKD